MGSIQPTMFFFTSRPHSYPGPPRALTGSSQGLMNDAWLSREKNNVLNMPSSSVRSLGKHKK